MHRDARSAPILLTAHIIDIVLLSVDIEWYSCLKVNKDGFVEI